MSINNRKDFWQVKGELGIKSYGMNVENGYCI